MVFASTIKLHGHSDDGEFYSRISIFLCMSLRPCHALLSTPEIDHGKDLTELQRYNLGAFTAIRFYFFEGDAGLSLEIKSPKEGG